MKIFIDSPLFIYLNTLTEQNVRAVYENYYIDILVKHKPYTDALVLDELIYVSRKKYGVPYRLTLEFIESNILPYISIVNLHEDEIKQAIKIMSKYNIKPSDALHIGAMINNNISVIVSEDKEFDKIQGIERWWIK